MTEQTVVVSAEVQSKLYLAYLGLSAQRMAAVDEAVKKGKAQAQATFDELFLPRLELYVERGTEKQEVRVRAALEILVARGEDRVETMKRLGLGE